jgi:ferric-dicitrate binding protein FerR (iron transport regulator)
MKITPQLIEKYLNNTCTPQERKAVDDWYQSFDEQPNPVDNMTGEEADILRESIYNRFKSGLPSANYGEDHAGQPTRRLYRVMYGMAGLAAAALLLTKVGVWFPNRHERVLAATTETQIAFRNATSSIHKHVLPDQSTVWLSPRSSIIYPKKFAGHFRNVRLTGEAFFEVTKDAVHPFVINSGELVTKVWGTSFRVRAYKNAPAEVAVVTGKVSVHNQKAHAEVMLLPNQKATLYHHEQLIKNTGNVVASEMRIWKKVSLSFDDARLSDVFAALNKNFDINIYSDDARINSYAFTGDFTNQSLPAILDMIRQSTNTHYTIIQGRSFAFNTHK